MNRHGRGKSAGLLSDLRLWGLGIFERYRFAFVCAMAFSAVLYFMMMSQQLTNTYDGLWQQNYRHAGAAELTSGRWALYFVDKLNMGLHSEPVASLAALTLFSLGFVLLLDLFKAENKYLSAAALILMLCSTAVSNTLSYRYTSMGYGFAFLAAALALYLSVKVKNAAFAVITGGLSLAFSLGCYQAYLGVFAVAALFYVIYLSQNREVFMKTLWKNLLKILLTAIFGGIMYFVILRIFLKIVGVSLSDYNGIGTLSPFGIVLALPGNILKTYRYFAAYYIEGMLKINRLQYVGGMYVLLGLLAVGAAGAALRAFSLGKLRGVLSVLAAVFIPVGCNAYMLIAGDKLELQMTAGLALMVPLTMLLLFKVMGRRYLKGICAVFFAAVLYGSSMQVLFDQQAMFEGRNACQTMANQILYDLKEQELLSPEYEYFFVGVPARNSLFSVSEIYSCANGYAQMGNFWVSGSCNQMSYNGLIQKYMGVTLPYSHLFYEDMMEIYDVSSLPDFPNDGYIELVEDRIVVIKVSDYVKYAEYSQYR